MPHTLSEAERHRLEQQHIEQLQRADADPDLPVIYANGFINSLGAGDIQLLLEQGTKPVARLFLSYTVAKTLAEKLGQLVAMLEDLTERSIPTTDDIGRLMEQRDDE